MAKIEKTNEKGLRKGAWNMFVLSLVWLLLSLFIVLRFVYRTQLDSSHWKQFSYVLQTPALGLLVFPKYLHASEKVQDVCIWVGGIVCLLSFIHIMKQAGLFSTKVIEKNK